LEFKKFPEEISLLLFLSRVIPEASALENTLRVTLKLCHEMLGAPVPDQYTEIKNLRAKVYCILNPLMLMMQKTPIPPYPKNRHLGGVSTPAAH